MTTTLALPVHGASNNEGIAEISATVVAVDRKVRQRDREPQGDGYTWSARIDADQNTWNTYADDARSQLRSRIVEISSASSASGRVRGYGAERYLFYATLFATPSYHQLSVYA